MNKHEKAIIELTDLIHSELDGTKMLDEHIGYIEDLKELVDKATPKKVVNEHKEYVFPNAYRLSGICPNCKNHVDESKYCSICGQKLDWR